VCYIARGGRGGGRTFSLFFRISFLLGSLPYRRNSFCSSAESDCYNPVSEATHETKAETTTDADVDFVALLRQHFDGVDVGGGRW
jgi:hypothetical protein